MDVALLSQALHHAPIRRWRSSEAARILRPGGRVLILDLRPHDETWVRDKLGDRWFGFSDDQLAGLLAKAGFSDVKVTLGARRTNDPFAVLLAIGTKHRRASKCHTADSGRSQGPPTTMMIRHRHSIAAGGAHPRARRRDGHHGPAPQAERGRLPRRALRAHPRDLKGNNDLLVLTRPDVIAGIHAEYLEAGADIIETNTFSATPISQADYGLEAIAYELNVEAARARAARRRRVDGEDPDQPRFVAGSMGPTNQDAVDLARRQQPGVPRITFDEMRDAFASRRAG